jgi:phospholipase/carboxylesterase
MGFSQGAMMAMYAMPRRAKPCAAVTAYSGMLVDAAGLKEQGIVKPPVLIVHGDADDVVPPFCLTDAARGLTDAGFSVETLMRAGLGHSIDSFSLQRGAAFILENL